LPEDLSIWHVSILDWGYNLTAGQEEPPPGMKQFRSAVKANFVAIQTALKLDVAKPPMTSSPYLMEL
jgi:hypothetical protein